MEKKCRAQNGLEEKSVRDREQTKDYSDIQIQVMKA